MVVCRGVWNRVSQAQEQQRELAREPEQANDTQTTAKITGCMLETRSQAVAELEAALKIIEQAPQDAWMADDKDLMKTALNYVIETLNHPKTKCLQPQSAYAALIACEKALSRTSSHSESALSELHRVLAEAAMRIRDTLLWLIQARVPLTNIKGLCKELIEAAGGEGNISDNACSEILRPHKHVVQPEFPAAFPCDTRAKRRRHRRERTTMDKEEEAEGSSAKADSQDPWDDKRPEVDPEARSSQDPPGDVDEPNWDPMFWQQFTKLRQDLDDIIARAIQQNSKDEGEEEA